MWLVQTWLRDRLGLSFGRAIGGHPIDSTVDAGDMAPFKVFISSTFEDMQREREILTRLVLPRLRSRSPLGVDIHELDLRWGLTQGMVDDGAVVGSCLQRVRASLPFVFGMLGHRVGEGFARAQVAAFDPEFARDAPPICSLTEWELRYAMACRQDGDPKIPVFQRSSRLSVELAYVDALTINPEAAALCSWLKRHEAIDFHEYNDFETFEEKAAAALTELLLAGRDRRGTFRDADPAIVRGRELRSLAIYARWGRRLIVHGREGAGCSWLLERWLTETDDHCLRLDGRNKSIAEIAQRVAALAEEEQPIWEAIAEPVAEALAIDRLAIALASYAKRVGRCTIVFDHFEEAFAHPASALLDWMPRLPRNCRLIVITHFLALVDRGRSQGWRTLGIEPPAADAVADHAVLYLARYSKTLEKDAALRLAHAVWRDNLHVARVALDELRRHARYDEVGDRVAALAAMGTISALVDTLLDGAERALPPEWRFAPRALILMLAISLRGLARAEIEMVLCRLTGSSELPSHVFGALRVMLATLVVEHDGLHDLHQSVVRDWLAQPQQQQDMPALAQAVEGCLGGFSPNRAILEAPNLAYRARSETGLANHLAGPMQMLALAEAGPIFAEGWLALLSAPAMAEVFEGWLAAAPAQAETRLQLADQMARFGDADRAVRLLATLEPANSSVAAATRLRIALIRRDRSGFAELAATAPPYRNRAQHALLVLAGTAAGLVESPRASDLALAEAEAAVRRTGSSLMWAEFHLLAGQVRLPQAQWRRSVAHFTEAEAGARRLGAAALLCLALDRKGAALIELHKFSAARVAAHEQLELAASVGLRRHHALAFERLADIAMRRADWASAYALMEEYLASMHTTGGDLPRAASFIEQLERRVHGG